MNNRTTLIAATIAASANLVATASAGDFTQESMAGLGLDGNMDTNAVNAALGSMDKSYSTSANFTVEAFTVQDTSRQKAYTIAYNAYGLPTKTSGLGLAFPTVLVEPKVGFVTLDSEKVTLMAPNLARKIGFGVGAGLSEFDKVKVQDIIRDPRLLLDNNSTEIKLAYKDAKPFVSGVKSVDVVGGEQFEEGFIEAKTKVSLIVLSASASALTMGSINDTDALTPDIKVKDIAVKLDGAPFVLPVGQIKEAQFTPHNGLNTSLSLNLGVDSYELDFSTMTSADGAATDAITGLTTGTVATVAINVNGSADTEGGTVSTTGYVTLVSVSVAGEVKVAGDSEFDDVAAIIDGAEYLGARIGAFAANDNLKKLGKQLDVVGISPKYPMTPLSPISAKIAINDAPEKKARALDQLIILGEAMAYAACAIELDRQRSDLKNVVINGMGDVSGFVGADKYVPYYHEDTIVIATEVANIRGKDGIEDVTGTLVLDITKEVTRMNSASQYGLGKDKVEYLVITSPAIAAFLPTVIEITDTITVSVTTDNFITFDGAAYIMPLSRTNSTDTVNFENFGVLAVEPTTVYDGPRDSSGAIYEGVVIQPIVKPIALLPILSVINVEGL